MTRTLAVAGAFAVLVVGVAVLLVLTAEDGSSADAGVQGDTDCNGAVNPNDALGALHEISETPPIPACIGAGDIDCNHGIDANDVTGILTHSAGFPKPQQQGGATCPAIGDPLPSATATPESTTAPAGTPTPTATLQSTEPSTATPTQGALPCDGPGGGPTLADAPSGSATPQADDYATEALLDPSYLGDAAEPVIELALIPGRPDEAIVAKQDGYMYRVSLSGAFQPQLWGDIHLRIAYGGEQGLLSLAFSPAFEEDCRVYVYYTPNDLDPTILARFAASPDSLDEGSEEVLLRVEEFTFNHNGGHIAFDSDGYLYLSTGDGGGGRDPQEKGQALNTLLGKVIRIDVSGESGYEIPDENPFTGQLCETPPSEGPPCDEIFAYGFRNPFRMTIDPVTDDVWLGDVGQDDYEEVDLVTAGGNYGWDCYEGFHEFEDEEQGYGDLPCTGPFEEPRAEYNHDFGQAVTGGVVYRGDDMPELFGWYIYGDFYSGRIWGVNTQGGGDPVHLTHTDLAIASFTLLPDGEIAIVSYSDGIHQLVP